MDSQLTRILIIAVTVALLSGCSTLQGTETDGTYTAPDGEFSVRVPPVMDVDCNDGTVGTQKEFVDCTMSAGYWDAEGWYSIEWYRLPRAYDSDETFYQETVKVLPTLVVGLMTAGGGTGFGVLQSTRLTVDGHPAYQVVTQGVKAGIPAYCVATSLDMGKRIAVAYLLVPVNDSRGRGPVDAAHAPDWRFYKQFMDSIKSHVSEQ